jgi:uncharacterized membrane protein YfcA
MIDVWLWLSLCILLAYTIEAITGFGSIVIALALGALLMPIPQLLPVLVPLNICMSGFLVLRNRRYIQWSLLFKVILPLMVFGTLAGHLLRPSLGDAALRQGFGLLVLGFALRESWRLWKGGLARVHPPLLSRALTLCAGLTHGLFASGGPLLVFAMAGTQLGKSELRATMLCVWFSLNSVLTVLYLLDGSLLPNLPRVISYLPLLLVGAILGEYLHRRLDEQRFRQIVYALLAVTGALLLIPR